MKIFIVGDYSPRGRVAAEFDKGNFEGVLGEIKPFTERNDFSIINFESCIIRNSDKAIPKCGPALGCKDNSLDAIKWAGFNVAAIANNHIFDYNQSAFDRTYDALKHAGFKVVGGGKNIIEAVKALILEKNGENLAIINCAEHEFTIATEEHGGANPLNPIHQFYQIKDLRDKVDYILVYVHGGHEYFQLPSPRMQEAYRFFIDAGADAVINNHQHCFSGYEVYNGKPIIYGLGNFCFDYGPRKNKAWHESLIAELNFKRDTVAFALTPISQCDANPKLEVLKEYAFNDRLLELNDIIVNPTLLKKKIDEYYSQERKNFRYRLEPFASRIMRGLQWKGLFPKLIGKQKLIEINNIVECESHRDKLIHMFHSCDNK